MREHIIYYLGLVIILAVGVELIFSLSPDRQAQLLVLVGLCAIYAVFGVLHQVLMHHLVGKIVIEYMLIALLGIAIAVFIYRGGFGI